MFAANHTIVDWGPMVCGYLIAQMILTTLSEIWKVTDTRMEYYHDIGLLGWLDLGLAHLILGSSSINSGPEQGDIWKVAVNTKILELGPDISQRPVMVIVTISFAIIGHILYRPVSHSLLL